MLVDQPVNGARGTLGRFCQLTSNLQRLDHVHEAISLRRVGGADRSSFRSAALALWPTPVDLISVDYAPRSLPPVYRKPIVSVDTDSIDLDRGNLSQAWSVECRPEIRGLRICGTARERPNRVEQS